MDNKRRVEVFSAGCACCDDAVSMVRALACPSCDVQVHDMRQAEVVEAARRYGITTVPAVVVDGTLAGCCQGRGPDEASLRASGIGQPMG